MKIILRVLTALLVPLLAFGHWQLAPDFGSLSAPDPISQNVSVEPLPLQVFCPGAMVEVGGESGVDLGSVERVGEVLISLSSNSEALLVSPEPISTSGAGAVASDSDQSTNLLAMVQTQAIERERAAGLSATYCQKPTSSGWLTNGSSTVGTESVLIAANPNEVEALVDIEFHLPSGVVSDRFALAGGEEKLITSAQYANGEEAFAVFFKTSGPEISMALQNRKTRGLSPVGIELEGVSPNPGTNLIFVGLQDLTEGFENPELRIYNPGQDVAEVVLSIFAEDNVDLYRQFVAGGEFSSLDFKIGSGYQLATLSSSTEVLASISNPSTKNILDFAWLQPAELFSSITLPLTSYRNTILVANPEATAIELRVETKTGDRIDVQNLVVAPFSKLAIPSAAQSVKLDSTSQFAVALEVLDKNGYSLIHPRENANLGNDLTILVN